MRRLAAIAFAAAAMLGSSAAPAHGSSPTFRLIYADGFNTPVKRGSFTDCDHATDTRQAYCSGLTGSVRNAWWAYPAGWPDTAQSGQLGHYPVGGYYDPASTIWIAPSAWGDGQMHIRMWRGPSGPVHSATVVPKAAIGLRYGRYEIRERVSHVGYGYKSAQLLWPVTDVNGQCPEVDFPENSHDVQPSAYDHPSSCGDQDAFDTGVNWSAWHTYDITWTGAGVTFAVDGRTIGTSRYSPSVPMDWDIQNESSLDGETAAPNSSDQIDITYIRVWSYT